jgi:hypothetical protein
MSIAMSADDLKQRGAKYVFRPAKKEEPTPDAPDPTLTDAINKVAEALAQGREEQRTAILHSIAVTESLIGALGAMGKKEATGPWTAKITARDKLGRISEVEFTPK